MFSNCFIDYQNCVSGFISRFLTRIFVKGFFFLQITCNLIPCIFKSKLRFVYTNFYQRPNIYASLFQIICLYTKLFNYERKILTKNSLMAEESPLGMGWNTAKHKQVPTMAIKMKPCKKIENNAKKLNKTKKKRREMKTCNSVQMYCT
jgi:hypothetical protein